MSSNRVAVVMKGYIGDTIMALPLLDSLRGLGVEPMICAPAIVGKVLPAEWLPMFHPLQKKRGLASFAEQGMLLRKLAPDAVILVNRSFRSALAARFSSAKQRIGHDTERRGFLLTHRHRYAQNKSESGCYLDLAKSLGAKSDDARPKMPLSVEERFEGARLAASSDFGIQPGARHEYKQVSLQNLADAANRLYEHGFTCVLLGGKDEVSAAEEFSKLLSFEPLNLVGELSLRQTAATAAHLRCLIGSDTGLMHLAASVGCPTITVFGPKSSQKWGHLYPPHIVVDAPNGDPKQVTAAQFLELALPLFDKANEQVIATSNAW